MTASTATKDAAWVRPHVSKVQGQEKPGTIPICVDNQGAIAPANKDGWNQRTKHINVRYQYVQQAVREGAVGVKYVASNEQLA